jgi:hypothetical protein
VNQNQKPLEPFTLDSVWIGMSLIGCAASYLSEDIKQWPFILMGNHDRVIKIALYYHVHQVLPTKDEDLEHEKVLLSLENLKAMVRLAINKALQEEERRLIAQKKMDHENIVREIQSHSAPSSFGTVSEISAKYHISKSEVRRMKAEGTLADFIKQKETQ